MLLDHLELLSLSPQRIHKTQTILMTRILITIFLFSAAFNLSAQEWTLERCVRHALDNNLTIKQAELTSRNAELTVQQNKYDRLPNLGANVNAGYQFGRTIDPTTNTFNNTRIGFNNLSINTGVTLFSGSRIKNNIKKSQFDLETAKWDLEENKKTIGLNVATAFLNILLGEEQFGNAQTQLDLSKDQLERTNRLITVGQLAPNARLDLEAQVARNEQILIDSKNSVDVSYLNLKQLLQLDPGENMVLAFPEITVEDKALVQDYSIKQVYQTALLSQPSVAAAESRLSSSHLDENIARSGFMPTLSASGSLSSIYSSGAPDFDNPNLDNQAFVQQTAAPVIIGGFPTDIAFFREEGVTFPTKGYSDQVTENFGQSVGLNLSIPIYSNHRNKINIERARLGVIGAELANRQTQDRLKIEVQNAVMSFQAARNSYLAADRSLTAAEAAYNDAQRRFDLGAINSFELNNAIDNHDIARVELTRAKYQFLFNMKVVEFYLGQGLGL